MSRNEKQIQNKRNKEKKTVGLMIKLYCHGNHGSKYGELCDDCLKLRDYAYKRVDNCPHMATKTFCFSCKTHCYEKEMRERIRQVMRWSGPRMIYYHPIMAIKHKIETKNNK